MSVYKIVELVGTSTSSWEDAAVSAVETAKRTLRDLRVAEVVEQDLDLSGDGWFPHEAERVVQVPSRLTRLLAAFPAISSPCGQ